MFRKLTAPRSRASLVGLALIATMIATTGHAAAGEGDKRAVLETYADIAQAKYEDSLTAAKDLRSAVTALLGAPDEASLTAAREAWIAARVPYQQSEAYRFGNALVDDWEGKVNAWPLDEGLIDYVENASYGDSSDENALYTANVIANGSLKLGGDSIDAGTITKALLADTLHEIDDVEANVATGYHAIEFLLWGQDLNGTGPGAGKRPASDFDSGDCSNGNCERRADYLRVATDLLIDDLSDMAAMWAEAGEAREAVMDGDPDQGLSRILTGMGSLSYGELAGERMKLGLLLHDPEEEHDCFSDNTHNSHYYNALGIQNVYLGRYRRIDGSVVAGASLAGLAAKLAPEVDKRLRGELEATRVAMGGLVASAEKGKSYDQLLAEGDAAGNALVQRAIDALTTQTRSIERIVAALKLSPIAFEGSDSLDNPDAVFQ